MLDNEVKPKKAAAIYLGVSTRTLDRMAKLETGPQRVRVGSRWMYRNTDLIAWLDRDQSSQNETNQDKVRHEGVAA
jgi:predicted DNA-binding transcriptional regulator AlpA